LCAEVDLTQNIVDVEFTNFCVVYQPEGIYNILESSSLSNASKGNVNKLGKSVATCKSA
jgi:hypothetical protein